MIKITMTFMTKMHGCKLLTKTVCKYTYEKNVIVKSRVLLLVVNTICLGGLKKECNTMIVYQLTLSS